MNIQDISSCVEEGGAFISFLPYFFIGTSVTCPPSMYHFQRENIWSINLGSNGNVPVAIFSTPDFDVTTVDPLSVTLAGAAVRIKGKGTPQASAENVNGDSLLDLIVHVDTTALVLFEEDTEAILEGQTYDGVSIRGVDTVRILQEQKISVIAFLAFPKGSHSRS